MADERKEKKSAEKATNCIKCNKRLKRKSCYYRDGAYYCTKGCFKAAIKKK